MFPKSRLVNSLTQKIRNTFMFSREYKNTIYNLLTGYIWYKPPAELSIPKNYYFNLYAKNMVTSVPPFLKDKAIKYDDGVPASEPQMAYDLTMFLAFLRFGKRPDLKFELLPYY